MSHFKSRDDSLTATGTRILKATLREKRILFLVPDKQDFETLLEDLVAVARALTSPRISFTGATHTITHGELSIPTYTIFGEVRDSVNYGSAHIDSIVASERRREVSE